MNSTIKSRFHPKNNLLQPSNSYKEAARQFSSFVHEHGSSQQCTQFVQCLCLISRYARVNTLADTRGVNIERELARGRMLPRFRCALCMRQSTRIVFLWTMNISLESHSWNNGHVIFYFSTDYEKRREWWVSSLLTIFYMIFLSWSI